MYIQQKPTDIAAILPPIIYDLINYRSYGERF